MYSNYKNGHDLPDYANKTDARNHMRHVSIDLLASANNSRYKQTGMQV
jgi:hypothetical protein